MDKSIVIFLGKQIKFSIINLFNLIILSSISFLMSSFLEYDECIFEILSINCLLFGNLIFKNSIKLSSFLISILDNVS